MVYMCLVKTAFKDKHPLGLFLKALKVFPIKKASSERKSLKTSGRFYAVLESLGIQASVVQTTRRSAFPWLPAHLS